MQSAKLQECVCSVHLVIFFFIISDVIKKWYLKMIVRTVITDSPDTRPEDPCLQDRCERHTTMMRYIGTYL